ncbi:hypothetical protein BG015_008826 [Linnemannia schmuckeri]|uniref:Uncharacterized protein n=1 Tax=Linnemannia schmuckeri TaxID=64567 RepID=A0A9P5RZZ4_9FUNG|nr:hypothetical protein BG015_008826 [Linnemannia schmuckeri]
MRQPTLTSALFGLRIWVAFMALVNLVIFFVYYGYLMPKDDKGLLQLRAIDAKIRHAKFIDRTTDADFVDPFACTGSDCHVFQSYMIFPVVTGFFALVEVLVTLIRDPVLPAAKEFKDVEDNAILMTK